MYPLSYAPDLEDEAQLLAQKYGLSFHQSLLPRLDLRADGLYLLDEHARPIALNWNDKQWKQRAKGAFGADNLIKACLAGQGLRILDLTAGFAKDALLMAYAGSSVHMLERHPMMAAMLDYAWSHVQDESLKSRTSFTHIEAQVYLQALQDLPEVIFFDPMHPQRDKSALVKKHLQVLQHMLGPNDDVLAIIELARSKCRQRLVVKWPAKSAAVLEPDFSLTGKTIRYDVYSAQ